MEVLKIGGKFLRSAEGFQSAGRMIGNLPIFGKYLIVVSAMAGVTRLLDRIFEGLFESSDVSGL